MAGNQSGFVSIVQCGYMGVGLMQTTAKEGDIADRAYPGRDSVLWHGIWVGY